MPFDFAQGERKLDQPASSNSNVLRGAVVEAIVALALEPEWRWCSADYASWDFERSNVRLEVKQSARKQSWHTQGGLEPRPYFDVRARSRWWNGAAWVELNGRIAQLYLFCWHDRDDQDADHRDPAQWSFYIVPEKDLPPTKQISLVSVQRLVTSCAFADLGDRVNEAFAKKSRLT